MEYIIHVPRDPYRGSNPRRRNKQIEDALLCNKIEAVLQRKYNELEPGEVRVVVYWEVATEIGEDFDQVRSIMHRIQGGSNGVTLRKPPTLGEEWKHKQKGDRSN